MYNVWLPCINKYELPGQEVVEDAYGFSFI